MKMQRGRRGVERLKRNMEETTFSSPGQEFFPGINSLQDLILISRRVTGAENGGEGF